MLARWKALPKMGMPRASCIPGFAMMLCSALKALASHIQVNPPTVAARGRSPQRKHFRESMAAKGVLCFVLISALATLATSRSPPAGGHEYYNQPICECINPFAGTRKEGR